MQTAVDSVSYAIGIDVAKNVKSSFDEFNSDVFFEAFVASLNDGNTLIDEAAAKDVIRNYFLKKQKAEEEKLSEPGTTFLKTNKTKEGVYTTASGLQYKILKEGTGAKPTKDSKVKVHYHGTLIDGTVFDSSVNRGEPIEFEVSQVIKGWTEGLQLMPEGSKYIFYIPHDLAYGANPRPGGAIKPYETLIFEVELLEIL
ncbi:FKBP-type peptidyl-prolyl cis-trans isomerase [Tamlana sp. s12]|uniref:FKBP-type peptidyl-prolyl cis-trans isomerase n=1 Tax=Tamlana sp. s12 TaxID=1630406 RepID=UPI00192BD13E|nr:FKBP-type peptidyl-prolyl cis-trans isomerase [Tamlana sp. s12]QQY82319.1 FKBP-type peptidyl-prolyl cis-trans isomerase [Tamlana sp. s12]